VVVSDILEAVENAVRRIANGQAPMRIPAEPDADPDLVLARCGVEIRSLRAQVEEQERELKRQHDIDARDQLTLAARRDEAEKKCVEAHGRRVLAEDRAEQAEAKLAEAQANRNGTISRLRARWPHIEIGQKGQRADPGSPTCLRCSIEAEIGALFADVPAVNPASLFLSAALAAARDQPTLAVTTPHEPDCPHQPAQDKPEVADA
jgi:hypothetical protein